MRATLFNFERKKLLNDSIGHPSQKLLSFEFAQAFCCQFWASWYIRGINQTSESKVIVVWICSVFLFSISCVSIYYRTKSDFPVKTYYRLNLLKGSVFNFEHLELLRDSIGHPSQKLLSFEFADSFYIQFRVSRIIKWLNRTSESKVIVIWICSELLFSISSVLIYYGTQSVFRVKSYCDLHFLRAFVFHYQCLDILRDSIGHLSWLLLLFAFFMSFHFNFRASPYITGLNRKSEWKLIVVWICSQFLYSVSTVSIYYGTQSDIWEKSYCRLNLLRVSVLNVVHFDILHDSIRLSSKNLLSFEFAESFCFQFRASRIIKGLNWTSELKVIVVWICWQLLYSILSISNY